MTLTVNWYWISMPHATGGVKVVNDRVDDAAPIFKWMMEKSWSETVTPWLNRKNAKWEKLPE